MKRPYATVIAQVDQTGRVTAVTLDDSSGDDGYDKSALAAMKKWTFEPARADCTAVAGAAEYVVGHGDGDFRDPCEHEVIALTPVTPADVRDEPRAEVDLVVSFDAIGRLTSVNLKQTNGTQSEVDSAVAAAMQTNYFPKISKCMPVSSQYIFHTTFDPGS